MLDAVVGTVGFLDLIVECLALVVCRWCLFGGLLCGGLRWVCPLWLLGLCGAGCWLRLVCLWVELLVMFAVLFEL